MKTKLGVSIELFGAALYFTGLAGIVPVVLLAGYALMVEENEWLKKTAVKAIGVVIFFAVLSAVIGLVGNSSTLLHETALLFKGTINLGKLNLIVAMCQNVVSLAQAIFLLLLGFKALKQGDVGLGVVDNIIKKNM